MIRYSQTRIESPKTALTKTKNQESEREMQTETTTSVQTGLKIILNGGKNQMDSATIPIQWFLSENLAGDRPTHILIVDQTEKNVTASRFGNLDTGRRYIADISKRIEFMQVFAPGRHRLTFIAIRKSGWAESDDCYGNGLGSLLVSDSEHYNLDADKLERVREGRIMCCSREKAVAMLAIATFEVVVPEELFARVGESQFGKWFYDWTNRWHTAPPSDECKYRARIIWAFTAQPILFVLGWIISLVFAAVITTVILLLRILVLFAGYRPAPIFSEVGERWTTPVVHWNDLASMNIVRRSQQRGCRYLHLQWVHWEDAENGKERFMPLAPWEVTAVFAALWFLWRALSGIDINSVLLVLLAMVALTAITLISLVIAGRFLSEFAWWRVFIGKFEDWSVGVMKKLEVKFKAKKEGAPAPPVDPYAEWLRDELVVGQVPSRVDLKQLPKAFRDPTHEATRVWFLATKARVCKPFAID